MKSIVVVRLIFMGLNRLKADVIRNYTKIFFIFLRNIVAAKIQLTTPLVRIYEINSVALTALIA